MYGTKNLKSIDLENNRLQTIGNVLPKDLLTRSEQLSTIDLSKNFRLGKGLNHVRNKLLTPVVAHNLWTRSVFPPSVAQRLN